MMIQWILPVILGILVLMIMLAFIGRHSRLKGIFKTLAGSLCDDGTARVRFCLRAFVVKGNVDGHPIRFTTSGDVKGSAIGHTYLLLEHPISGNFRFYRGGEISLVPQGIRKQIVDLEQLPGFYALIFTSRKTPLFARLLSRPIGLGYRPGLLLCLVEKASFEADAVRERFAMLIDLAEHGA